MTRTKPSEAPLTRVELARLMQAFGEVYESDPRIRNLVDERLPLPPAASDVEPQPERRRMPRPIPLELADDDSARASYAIRNMADRRHAREHASVYFIQAGTDGLVKIGWALNASLRLRDLQIGSPVELILLGVCSGGDVRERELHARFAAHRARGEWFRPAPELLEFIAEEATKP